MSSDSEILTPVNNLSTDSINVLERNNNEPLDFESSDNEMVTPVCHVSRDRISVLVRNNVLNQSLEFQSDSDDEMDVDSPMRKPKFHGVNKRLFHTPNGCAQRNNEQTDNKTVIQPRRNRKRKQFLFPPSEEKIKAYVKESEGEEYRPKAEGGPRKKMLLSLFHNKEYYVEIAD